MTRDEGAKKSHPKRENLSSEIHTSLHKKLILSKKNYKISQLAVRIKYYTENRKVTYYIENMSLVEGYTIPFHEVPQQKNIPNSTKLSQEERILVQEGIQGTREPF